MLHTKVLEIGNPKSSKHKKNIFLKKMLCPYEGWLVTKPTVVVTSQCKLNHYTTHLKLK